MRLWFSIWSKWLKLFYKNSWFFYIFICTTKFHNFFGCDFRIYPSRKCLRLLVFSLFSVEKRLSRAYLVLPWDTFWRSTFFHTALINPEHIWKTLFFLDLSGHWLEPFRACFCFQAVCLSDTDIVFCSVRKIYVETSTWEEKSFSF